MYDQPSDKATRPPRKRKSSANSLPYEGATSGKNATTEMEKVLRTFGATSFGCMENYDTGEIIVQFTWRDRNVTIRASGKGWAALYLKRHPRMQGYLKEQEQRALAQGKIAVYSMLRDWIKGQITAVECGLMTFEGAFLSNIMLPSGETVLERVTHSEMLAIAPPTH
jgi:hypothetical protein